jgi:putative membrane protein
MVTTPTVGCTVRDTGANYPDYPRSLNRESFIRIELNTTSQHTLTMIQFITILVRTARRTTLLAIPLLSVATGTVTARPGGSYGGGMMGGGWGLFGGAMGLWGLLWMGLLLAIPLFLVYLLVTRHEQRSDDSLSVLRERYAQGDITDDEFERRQKRLEESE